LKIPEGERKKWRKCIQDGQKRVEGRFLHKIKMRPPLTRRDEWNLVSELQFMPIQLL